MRDWSEHLRSRLATLRLGSAREAEIIEEMSQHLDERYAELRARGATHDDALRAALEELEEPDAMARHMNSLRQAAVPSPTAPGASTGSLLGDAWQDARLALRSSRKQPGFAAAVVMTLALGIGATTAIFTVVHGVILKPLAFPESERIIALYHNGLLGSSPTVMNHGPATYFRYRDNQRTFEDIGAWDQTEVAITGGGDPERVRALAVTDGTLPVLGVAPLLGRFFSSDEARPGDPLTLVLTHGYWQRRFGGADVIGRSISVDGEPATIIGVLPESFRFPRVPAEVLVPLQLDRADANDVSFGFQVIGRLRPGGTLDEASADVGRLIALVEEEVPNHASLELQPNLFPLVRYASAEMGRVLWILFGTVGIVLLIACANVANLFLVRAEGRQQELAVRTVLGASRGRVARALLTESVVLGIAGGAVGLALAAACAALLRGIAPATLPRVEEIGIGAEVVLFTLLVSVVVSVLFGLIPVSRLRAPSSASLRQGGRGASDAPSRLRIRSVLAVSQVAMAFVLLITAGLMVRTSVAMRQVSPGFARPENVQTFRVEVPEAFRDDDREMIRIHQSIGARLAAVSGVASVGIASSVTLDGEDNLNPIILERDLPCAEECWHFRRFKTVAPGHFETMGNPIVAGRDVSWEDIYEQRPVVVISENLAREFWGGAQNALGARVKPVGATAWREVVGVVGDERDDGLNRPATGILYWPLLNDGYVRSTLVYSLRSDRVGTPGFLPELREAVWSVNSNLPLASVMTLDEIVADSMAQTSFAMVMLAIAASVALLLGVVGIYAIIAYVAAQRTREIGIRVALGAEVRNVRGMFLGYGLRLAGIGVALGVAAAVVLTRAISAMLFGVATTDPLTYSAVAAGLAGVALVAADLPARRAARVDPIVAMRAET